MSQNRRSDDVDNGSRRNKESEHESTAVSASRSLEREEVLLSPELQHVIARILETLVPSPNSQFEHGNLGSQTYNSGSEDGSRPVSALMKVIEVMVIRTVQHSITSVIEDLFRRVAKEVIEAEVEKILTRNSRIEMHSPTKSLELRFCDNLSLPVWTGSRIEREGHKPLQLALFDSETGQVVDSGPEASAEFEVFLLQGDIERNAVGECKKKNYLLKGNTNLKLNKGTSSLRGISFKHKSNWTKKCELRLWAKIVDPVIGMRVKEAKTEPFTIKDKRVKLNKKHDCPSLSDPVWRLKNIDKRGVYYRKLREKGITTVQKFLTEYYVNPQGLQNILGTGTSSKMWEVTLEHARTCVIDSRIYFYCPPGSQQKTGVVFNVVGQVMGLYSECQYAPVDEIPETQKADAHDLLITAFEHWDDVVPFDDQASLMNGLSRLFNNVICSNSATVETSDSSKNLASQKIGEFDYPRSSERSPDIMPSIFSVGGVNSLDDFGLHELDNIDLSYDQTLNFPSEAANSLVHETESMNPAFCEDEHLQYFDADCSLQPQKPSLGLQDELHSAVNGFLLARSAAFAQRRWKMLFSVLRWFSIRRIMANKIPCQRSAEILLSCEA